MLQRSGAIITVLVGIAKKNGPQTVTDAHRIAKGLGKYVMGDPVSPSIKEFLRRIAPMLAGM